MTTLFSGGTGTGFFERGSYGEARITADDPMSSAAVVEAGYRRTTDRGRLIASARLNTFRVFLERLLPRRLSVTATERSITE